MKKQFLTYNELNEALKLSQYRDYHGIKIASHIKKFLKKGFGDKNRIYIPYKNLDLEDYYGISSNYVPIKRILEDKGYEIVDYYGNVCKIKGTTRNFTKITKVLGEFSELYSQDYVIYSYLSKKIKKSDNRNLIICISKHPYDIAGMSTDRGWTSCMNLEEGGYKEYIRSEIKEGSVVAYLIFEDDKNINNPIARVTCKPYFNGLDMILHTEGICYGIRSVKFSDFYKDVQKWLNENINIHSKDGTYDLSRNVYKDNHSIKIQKDKDSIEISDFENIEYIYDTSYIRSLSITIFDTITGENFYTDDFEETYNEILMGDHIERHGDDYSFGIFVDYMDMDSNCQINPSLVFKGGEEEKRRFVEDYILEALDFNADGWLYNSLKSKLNSEGVWNYYNKEKKRYYNLVSETDGNLNFPYGMRIILHFLKNNVNNYDKDVSLYSDFPNLLEFEINIDTLSEKSYTIEDIKLFGNDYYG